MTLKQMQSYHKAIPVQMGRNADHFLAGYFFEGLVEVEKQISAARDNFVQVERIKSEASVGFSLRTKIRQSMKHLS